VKRVGGLWPWIVTWENLVLAAQKAQRGKRTRHDVLRFNFRQEAELLALQEELSQGTYRPGPFRVHWITRPKLRQISAAPYRDRVVHHALMNVLEPILERHFHPHSFACRKSKGTHAAADHLQRLMRRYRYALQCDIRKFFPSVDHALLKGDFPRLIKDRRALALMDLIVDHSNEQESAVAWLAGDDLWTPMERRRGLPLGNLTSQWFANWFLTGLDHHVTGPLRIAGYVRYCDDFILLDDDRGKLGDAANMVKDWLAGKRLLLHARRLRVSPVCAGLPFVGFRVWPTHRLLKKDNVRAFRRRVRWMQRAYARGEIEWEDVKMRLNSWLGHAKQADSGRLVRRVSADWTFARGGA